MKLAILSRNTRLYSTRRLVEAARTRGHTVRVLDPLRCYMRISSDGFAMRYKGKPIEVPLWTFPSVDLVEAKFWATNKAVKAAEVAVGRLPGTPTTRAWAGKLHKNSAALDTLKKFMGLYKAYTKTEMVFDDANTRRSAQAAAAAAARVERAMDILGDDVPEHLAEAGFLRVEHRHASLEELGRLADPQMTKDAVAGRIRRLLSLADKRAAELGVPDTHGPAPENVPENG